MKTIIIKIFDIYKCKYIENNTLDELQNYLIAILVSLLRRSFI